MFSQQERQEGEGREREHTGANEQNGPTSPKPLGSIYGEVERVVYILFYW
jgi:hypothetical protein